MLIESATALRCCWQGWHLGGFAGRSTTHSVDCPSCSVSTVPPLRLLRAKPCAQSLGSRDGGCGPCSQGPHDVEGRGRAAALPIVTADATFREDLPDGRTTQGGGGAEMGTGMALGEEASGVSLTFRSPARSLYLHTGLLTVPFRVAFKMSSPVGQKVMTSGVKTTFGPMFTSGPR